jgi:transcription-repair coupling factor (superfamily II helicase)
LDPKPDASGRRAFEALGTVGEPLAALLGREGSVSIGGLYGAAGAHLLALLSDIGLPLLVLCADARVRDSMRLDLETFLGFPPAVLPAWPRGDTQVAPDAEVLRSRAALLDSLESPTGEPVVIVATLEALSQVVPSPEVIARSHLRLAPGETQQLEVLQEHLAGNGYTRVPSVEAVGEFAARGGLLDVWPWGAEQPVRLDFFGDEIESLHVFDPLSQRSAEAVPGLDLPMLPPERYRKPSQEEGAVFLLDWLPAGTRVVLVERPALIGAATTLRGTDDGDVRARVRRLERALGKARTLMISATPLGAEGDLDLQVGSLDRIRGIALRSPTPEEAAEDRAARIGHAFAELGVEVDSLVIYRRAAGEEERLQELLEVHAPTLRVDWRPGSLTRSFLWRPTRTAHVAYDDLADLPAHERRTVRRRTRSRPIENFLELQHGGLVVHLHHGIGIFRGLQTIEGPDGEGEYLLVEFAEGTKVFVPVSRIDLVQRYVGSGRHPRLSKVGGVEWERRKQKVAAAVEELADELLETQAARAQRRGAPLGPDAEWQREFEAAFPYEDTPDQATATKALKADLEGPRPMDRLLCGDVGYGKTEVALRAIFKVVTSGRQAAVLVPTKILAEQHTRVFTQRLASWPVRVRALSGLHSAADNRRTIQGLKDGSIDVCVGTHRLLSKDVGFLNLGMLVVDEEQRFGVKHKERLKSLRSEVDILSLSATPIPRTLHMALLGIRDISNLTTPPLGRHPIETHVAREDDGLIVSAIQRELARGGQAFLVSSRIRELPILASRLVELIPELRVTFIHGRMEKEMIERRMLRFVRGEVDLLLATTIIESGLDIPNANTIIIRDADRYGLAELHQLRGRVGRERRRAHALILLPRDRTINSEANERLRAVEEYSELGAGFRIAMRDLEIRGAGNLLGSQQSGHIAAVGYDLYCKLLGKAVLHAQGRREQRIAPAYLGIDLPGSIPDDWVGDPREKFRLFRRIAGAGELEDLDSLEEEMTDRFGRPPAGVGRLLLAQKVRISAGAKGIERLEPGPEDVPGVVLVGPLAARQALQRGTPTLRPLGGDQLFLPTPGARGVVSILRAVLKVL